MWIRPLGYGGKTRTKYVRPAGRGSLRNVCSVRQRACHFRSIAEKSYAVAAALGRCVGPALMSAAGGDLVDDRVGGTLDDARHATLAQVRVDERVGVPVGWGEAVHRADLPAELAPDAA